MVLLTPVAGIAIGVLVLVFVEATDRSSSVRALLGPGPAARR